MILNYLIESLDSLSLEKERNKIIKDIHFEVAFISSYDLEEGDQFNNILEDLDTYGFLTSSKKVILIKNLEGLKVDDFSQEFEHLFNYLSNPNPDHLLIIEARKLNNTLKVVKQLKKLCQFISISIDTKTYIKDTFKGFKIDSKTIDFLDQYCMGDFTKVANECEKLKSYKWDEKSITISDIEELVAKKMGDSSELTFAFSRSLAMKDVKDALEKYRELLSYHVEPFKIIGLLASQIRIIYQVKLLAKDGLSNREIADQLEEKSDYRIKKTRELISLYTEDELLRLMQQLSDMDLKMKSEDVDANAMIELFIINI